MSEPHVTLDPAGLDPARRHLRGPLEEQLSSALRAATERVWADYAGEPVEVVCRRLLDETRAGLHPDIADGFTPDMDEFCRVAVAIVRRDPAGST
ncbi:hypothetical protein [Plantactinospora endophytica]|uniref:Uncharacterized protein n=1 Tax=Plantactinospora endophytica TaxID=673535 RepID=A0ABQ4E0V4_9ACTN|nr:hypothetical protein [Plantactinospora endophytica]GIG88308.1 hypothetical protein Pen02_32440 [Plantactinospora endophytica]